MLNLLPDLRAHSVAYFLEPLLAAHDRDRFESFAYCDGIADEVTLRISGAVDVFRTVTGTTDEELAAILESDEPDVLVELAGHTAGNRMALLASRRLAPWTMTYLGYPSTTGNPGINVRITDALVDGPDALSTETLSRMPSPAWRYRPPSDAPPIRARIAASELLQPRPFVAELERRIVEALAMR